MKARAIIYIGLIIFSYYLIYVGAVGIKIPISYGYVPTDQSGYYPLITGNYALLTIAIGGILFSLAYMHMGKYYKWNNRILSHRHCEKTSFLWVLGVIAVIYFLVLMIQNQFNYPIEWFYLAIMTAVGAYAGVLYYRVTNHKKVFSIDSLMFWSAKS